MTFRDQLIDTLQEAMEHYNDEPIYYADEIIELISKEVIGQDEPIFQTHTTSLMEELQATDRNELRAEQRKALGLRTGEGAE